MNENQKRILVESNRGAFRHQRNMILVENGHEYVMNHRDIFYLLTLPKLKVYEMILIGKTDHKLLLNKDNYNTDNYHLFAESVDVEPEVVEPVKVEEAPAEEVETPVDTEDVEEDTFVEKAQDNAEEVVVEEAPVEEETVEEEVTEETPVEEVAEPVQKTPAPAETKNKFDKYKKGNNYKK